MVYLFGIRHDAHSYSSIYTSTITSRVLFYMLPPHSQNEAASIVGSTGDPPSPARLPVGRRSEASVVVPLQPQGEKNNESYLRKELDIKSKRVAELETRVEELTIQTQVCEAVKIHYICGMMNIVINPRRACAERVTVVVLCVCMSVTHTLFWQYARLKV